MRYIFVIEGELIHPRKRAFNMEEDIRKPVVYLDLQETDDSAQSIKPDQRRSREETASLKEREAFWIDLIDR